ncbi:MAG: SAM-dependent chlorinase/fluorinase [Candidatus Aenigmatarchaeota archaeon]
MTNNVIYMSEMNICVISDLEDFYVAQIFGKIYEIYKHNINTLNVRVKNFSIIEACFKIYVLDSNLRDTIFICVIDPYVGTERKVKIIKKGKNFLIGPDNGIFSLIENFEKIIEVDTKKFNASATFHGRDIFAVIAGKILKGEKIENFGKECSGIEKLDLKNRILYIDEFGSIITSIKNGEIKANLGEILKVKISNEKDKKGKIFEAKFVRTFADEKEKLIIYKGSSGFLEIGKFMDNTAKILNVNIEDRIEILNL